MRVLIVEDEEFMAEAINDRLAMESITTWIVGDGDAALEILAEQDFDVVILDRDIPGVHGDEVCRRLAADPQAAAVLMLTAAGDLEERVAGLDLGADDYMSKPFEFAELIARIRALSRRKFTRLPPVLERGGIRVDSVLREASRDGIPVALTPKEFTVLELLMQAGGQPLSAETLLEQAWDANANPFTHAVKVTISTLRRKLGEPSPIRTISGAGYVFV